MEDDSRINRGKSVSHMEKVFFFLFGFDQNEQFLVFLISDRFFLHFLD